MCAWLGVFGYSVSHREVIGSNRELSMWETTVTTLKREKERFIIPMAPDMKVGERERSDTLGCVCAGNWTADRRHRVGKYTYVNSDTYEGDWENNLRHGQGVYTFAATGVQVRHGCRWFTLHALSSTWVSGSTGGGKARANWFTQTINTKGVFWVTK